jgi:hypothetical protein
MNTEMMPNPRTDPPIYPIQQHRPDLGSGMKRKCFSETGIPVSQVIPEF